LCLCFVLVFFLLLFFGGVGVVVWLVVQF